MAVLEKGGKPAATRKAGIFRGFLQVMRFVVRDLDMPYDLVLSSGFMN